MQTPLEMRDEPPDDYDVEILAGIAPAEAEFDRGEDRPFEDVAAELRNKYLGK
jgi:hypothetical protein